MPSLNAVLRSWALDPVALLVLVASAALYLGGVRAAKRHGVAWPLLRTLSFFVLGLGAYAVISFGFLGANSQALRVAFTTRVALLMLLAPALAVIGRPAGLLRAATTGIARARVEAVFASRAFRLLGNAIVAPLIPFAIFLVLLTPVAGWLRVTTLGEAIVSVLMPLIGLAIIVPLAEVGVERTSTFITAEFLIAFVELVLDAIPGIVMRLSGALLDKAPAVVGAVAVWHPSPLRDQQLAGDLLWFIAEVGDIPALILLFVRWTRTDKKEARSIDDLSDEEYAALSKAHLRGTRDDPGAGQG